MQHDGGASPSVRRHVDAEIAIGSQTVDPSMIGLMQRSWAEAERALVVPPDSVYQYGSNRKSRKQRNAFHPK